LVIKFVFIYIVNLVFEYNFYWSVYNFVAFCDDYKNIFHVFKDENICLLARKLKANKPRTKETIGIFPSKEKDSKCKMLVLVKSQARSALIIINKNIK
jgi:hypothetical protein